jgi:hypothetical protein
MFAFFKATTKLKANVLYFSLLPNGANATELKEMIDLILNHVGKSKKNTFINLATLDNETPLSRALCHPVVTKELIEKLFNKNEDIDGNQLLATFDRVAHRRKDVDQLSVCLDLLVDRLKRDDDYLFVLNQLSHIICRHNNESLLKWFYEYMKKVRS